jgi:hypothetical protein
MMILRVIHAITMLVVHRDPVDTLVARNDLRRSLAGPFSPADLFYPRQLAPLSARKYSGRPQVGSKKITESQV